MAIPELLTDAEWVDVVKCHLGDETEFEILSVNVGKISENMVGFLGDHLQVEVTIHREKCHEESLHFFVKRLPTNLSCRTDYITSSNAFEKETGLYSEVFEQYRKYGLIAGRGNDSISVGKSQPSPWAPESYLTRPDLVVQENLAVYDFRICDNSKYMDYGHCEVILQTLAKFHAASIIFEEIKTHANGKRYRLNETYSHILSENIFSRTSKSKLVNWFHSTIKVFQSIINLLPKYRKNTKYHDKIHEKLREKCEMMFEYVKPSDTYRNVLCHGDLWTNNILLRYNKEHETPEEVRFIDFQLCRYAPPAVDVLMFLHLTTSRSFRAVHRDSLLSSYHASLSRELLGHGEDPEELLSWESFKDSCRHFSGVGRIVAPAYHHLHLLPQDVLAKQLESPDTFDVFLMDDRDDIVRQCFASHADFRERLTEGIEELLECFVLEIKTH